MSRSGSRFAGVAIGAVLTASALFSAAPAIAEERPIPDGATVDAALCVLPTGAYRLDYTTSGWPTDPAYEMRFWLGEQFPDPVAVNTSGSIVTTLTTRDWNLGSDARPLPLVVFAEKGTEDLFGYTVVSKDPPTALCPDSDASVAPDRGVGVNTGIVGTGHVADSAPVGVVESAPNSVVDSAPNGVMIGTIGAFVALVAGGLAAVGLIVRRRFAADGNGKG